jgi:tetratricopeptide (TPR) repeat protein
VKPIKFQPLALLALALCSTIAAPASADDVVITQKREHGAEVDAGFDALVAGEHAKAERIFARVIKAFEKQHAGDRTYRCAEGMDDTLKVTLLEASKQGPGQISVLGPDWCLALFGMGYVLIDLKRSDEAGAYLARAVEMAPTRAHYINEYAEWHKSRRDWTKSLELFTRAWDVVDRDKQGPDRMIAARALRGMGFNQIELGDLIEARRLFKQSLEFEPENTMAKSELDYIDRLEATRGKAE